MPDGSKHFLLRNADGLRDSPDHALRPSKCFTTCDSTARARCGPAPPPSVDGGDPACTQQPRSARHCPLLPFPPFGWPGFLLGSLGADDVCTLDGSGGIGWLGLVPGRNHTG